MKKFHRGNKKNKWAEIKYEIVVMKNSEEKEQWHVTRENLTGIINIVSKIKQNIEQNPLKYNSFNNVGWQHRNSPTFGNIWQL